MASFCMTLGYFIDGTMFWTGYSKHLSRILRLVLYKSNLMPEIRLLTRCKAATLSRVTGQAILCARLEMRLGFAVFHHLSNRISDILCDLYFE